MLLHKWGHLCNSSLCAANMSNITIIKEICAAHDLPWAQRSSQTTCNDLNSYDGYMYKANNVTNKQTNETATTKLKENIKINNQ